MLFRKARAISDYINIDVRRLITIKVNSDEKQLTRLYISVFNVRIWP